ncbi:MAG: hypothetical protein IJE46_05080 [Clostridia bacterium]|nr:hypothetical protein [Clostridia bacterium]
MIISNIRLPFTHTKDQLEHKIKQMCGHNRIYKYQIRRKSVDARNKSNILYVYTVEVYIKESEYIEKKLLLDDIKEINLKCRPVIAGTGPAGLFCGLYLAKAGLCPILLEQGNPVEKRAEDVNSFWQKSQLNESSNIQFGEGGAGTFSDGKLNTGIKGTLSKEVLEVFARFGAGEEITYLAKPHIGTDVLRKVIVNIRNEIISLGGEFHFGSKMHDFAVSGGKVESVFADKEYKTECLVLAIGHSARETFALLHQKGVILQPKPFSVGFRIEHPQKLINMSQYGILNDKLLAADYKLSEHLSSGRGVYTFCMCPGGYVVGASSENGGVVTNGMSYRKRDAQNANSALLVSVTPEDFAAKHSLSGIDFQREIEKRAFSIGGENFNAPCQLLGDFLKNKTSDSFGDVSPTYLPGVKKADITKVLPEFVCDALKQVIPKMAEKIKNFDLYDAVLTAAETRSSSPVRILRNDEFEASTRGIYPTGEGAGYAGGITSSAADGIRVALKIIEKSRKV